MSCCVTEPFSVEDEPSSTSCLQTVIREQFQFQFHVQRLAKMQFAAQICRKRTQWTVHVRNVQESFLR